jgi:hypothetical protein
VRKAAYGREDPQVASTLVGFSRLALPGQMVEIKFVAKGLADWTWLALAWVEC